MDDGDSGVGDDGCRGGPLSHPKIPNTMRKLSKGRIPTTINECTEVVSQVIDPMSTEWTDEKHCMYLNSIEASFIDQLYSSECQSKNLLRWFSRTHKHPNSSGSNANSPLYGQFKIQRKGCWENRNFEKVKSHINIENESCLLAANQWVKHFRSPSIGNEEHHSSPDGTYTKGLACQRHARDLAVRKHPLACCSQIYHQESVGSNTEVSDQNFVEKESEAEENLNYMCGRKRTRTSVTAEQFKDQVVPSGIPFRAPNSDEPFRAPDSDENHACLKAKDAKLEPDPPLLKDQ